MMLLSLKIKVKSEIVQFRKKTMPKRWLGVFGLENQSGYDERGLNY